MGAKPMCSTCGRYGGHTWRCPEGGLEAVQDAAIDTSEVPLLGPEFFENAVLTRPGEDLLSPDPNRPVEGFAVFAASVESADQQLQTLLLPESPVGSPKARS